MSSNFETLKEKSNKNNVVILEYSQLRMDPFSFVGKLEEETYSDWGILYLNPKEHEDYEKLKRDTVIFVSEELRINPSNVSVASPYKIVYIINKIPSHRGWERHWKYIMEWEET